MRAGERYDCRQCGRRDRPRVGLCDTWCGHARDEHGNAPPLPAHEVSERLVRGAPGGRPAYGALFTPMFDELALAYRQSRSRRRLKERLAACGEPAPIGTAPEGLVRVEGEVRVLEPAPRAKPDVAAFVWRRVVEREGAGLGLRRIETRRGCGRFLVEDDTGVALIDDDFLELRDFAGHEPEPSEPGGLRVRDGELVTVLGRARRGAAELPADVVQPAGYRGRALPLIFDGSSDERLVVFCDPEA